MSDRQLPSPELLRQLLRYEPETGNLFWMERPLNLFATNSAAKTWNARFAHKPAMITLDTHGYRRGEIFGRGHLAHRVVWTHQTGAWPEGEIDHINGERADNRWVNLRSATRSENMRNRRSEKSSTSVYLGVSWDSNALAWKAQIAGRHIGNFTCETDAAKAYDAAAMLLYGEFANPNFALLKAPAR